MELGAQIRKCRTEMAISQDELAEKVFVSRQSISNWETGKTYPDIKSLLLLSEVFSVSLDQLIQTYKEIVAFSEGKSLDEIEKARESGKRPYQKVALAMGSALLGVIVTAFMIWLLK